MPWGAVGCHGLTLWMPWGPMGCHGLALTMAWGAVGCGGVPWADPKDGVGCGGALWGAVGRCGAVYLRYRKRPAAAARGRWEPKSAG